MAAAVGGRAWRRREVGPRRSGMAVADGGRAGLRRAAGPRRRAAEQGSDAGRAGAPTLLPLFSLFGPASGSMRVPKYHMVGVLGSPLVVPSLKGCGLTVR